MFTKKLFWVLVIGFFNLVSVDAKERSIEGQRKIENSVKCVKTFCRKKDLVMQNYKLGIHTQQIVVQKYPRMSADCPKCMGYLKKISVVRVSWDAILLDI